MEHFSIGFLNSATDLLKIEGISVALDKAEKYLLKFAPWPEFSYHPNVNFSVAHDGDNIFLKYYVEENAIKADYREINDPVYKDSCVEFFIDFNDGKGYYNLEFNCAGTCRIGFGKEKEGRVLISKELIKEINYQTRFKDPDASAVVTIQWELSLIIPKGVFCYHKLPSLSNKVCNINFYKCGDDLPQPHFLSWVNIHADTPNFHLPEFFKKAIFISSID